MLETNMNEIVTQVDAENKMEKSEVRAHIADTLATVACLWNPACPHFPGMPSCKAPGLILLLLLLFQCDFCTVWFCKTLTFLPLLQF